MELDCSLPHSQKSATSHYQGPCPDQSNSCPLLFIFLKIHFNITVPQKLSSSIRSLSHIFFHQNPPVHVTCPTNLSLLAFITRIIFGEQYRPWSSSPCSFLYSPVASFLLGPNILLRTLFWNTLNPVTPFMWATRFHTHTKQQEKL
jgi:hypothetical protein